MEGFTTGYVCYWMDLLWLLMEGLLPEGFTGGDLRDLLCTVALNGGFYYWRGLLLGWGGVGWGGWGGGGGGGGGGGLLWLLMEVFPARGLLLEGFTMALNGGVCYGKGLLLEGFTTTGGVYYRRGLLLEGFTMAFNVLTASEPKREFR